MGHYSILKVGNEVISWKYDIPSYLSFLFDKKELYKKAGKENGEKYLKEVGFRTTCKKALLKLDSFKFNWDLIEQVYSIFYDELKDEIEQALIYEIQERYKTDKEQQIEAKLKAHFNKFPSLTKTEELKDFSSFFLPLIQAASGKKSSAVKSIDKRTYKLEKDNNIYGRVIDQGIDEYLYNKSLNFPPWILMISRLLFDYDLLQEFSEVIFVIRLKYLLESQTPSTMVDLDLSDIVEFEEEVSDFHLESANRLIQKINLYNKFFDSIINQEKIIREVYFNQNIEFLTNKAKSLKKTEKFKKGKVLEDLMEFIFSSIDGFEITEKRMLNGDEEIDLIIKNNINKPFWSSLSSPCIFVECKNWSDKVGAKEIRDFECKMENHNRLVKIGIFVSFNGFTKEAIIELKRASSKGVHISIIEEKDIVELIKKADVTSWLEKIIVQFH